MAQPKKERPITPQQKLFCSEYIFDWNATRAYQKAYPKARYTTSMTNGCRMLRSAKILAYIEEIQKDIGKEIGVSPTMVANEFKKMAFSSIAHMHNTWIELKEFEKLIEDQKACIAEIQTRSVKTKTTRTGSRADKPD